MTAHEAAQLLRAGLEQLPNPLADPRPDGSKPNLYDALDYLTPAGLDWRDDPPLPEHYQWVACYAVTGNSEGHYIHVDVVLNGYTMPQERTTVQHIALGKTFCGWDVACLVAAACSKLLDA